MVELATRYASALFELADEQRQLDVVAEELKAFCAAIAEDDDLARLVRSPVLSREEKQQAVDALLTAFGASELTHKFIGYLASRRRLFLVVQATDQFLKDLARRRGEVAAKVISAQRLSAEQEAALTDQIKKQVGAKVQVELSVDPTLLGGMVVQVGSRMVDTSLRTQLQKLETAMKGAA